MPPTLKSFAAGLVVEFWNGRVTNLIFDVALITGSANCSIGSSIVDGLPDTVALASPAAGILTLKVTGLFVRSAVFRWCNRRTFRGSKGWFRRRRIRCWRRCRSLSGSTTDLASSVDGGNTLHRPTASVVFTALVSFRTLRLDASGATDIGDTATGTS